MVVYIGTVTDDILNTVRTSKSSFDFKADKHGVLHTGNCDI
jgi:large subunit ribosomal protein L1